MLWGCKYLSAEIRAKDMNNLIGLLLIFIEIIVLKLAYNLGKRH